MAYPEVAHWETVHPETARRGTTNLGHPGVRGRCGVTESGIGIQQPGNRTARSINKSIVDARVTGTPEADVREEPLKRPSAGRMVSGMTEDSPTAAVYRRRIHRRVKTSVGAALLRVEMRDLETSRLFRMETEEEKPGQKNSRKGTGLNSLPGQKRVKNKKRLKQRAETHQQLLLQTGGSRADGSGEEQFNQKKSSSSSSGEDGELRTTGDDRSWRLTEPTLRQRLMNPRNTRRVEIYGAEPSGRLLLLLLLEPKEGLTDT
ncbi:hypothetical protein FQA47_009248 [Oryzias melastigma]|uniref:Uncharacterized protein n=1 Tax=Oryzias melastigma TaxID=30732 RepID=A0A834FC92_ORYME|nr:hypothetical protein FQA47_009248 [Oryzias melastigma]